MTSAARLLDRLPKALDPLRERNFRAFFLGQAISLLGTGTIGVALSFAVLDSTGSVSDLGFVLAARTVAPPGCGSCSVLQAIADTARAFFTPAVSGLTTELVGAERLQEANALRSLASSLGNVGGPAIGGVLVATVGAGRALAADAASFAASAAFLARLRLPPHERLPAGSARSPT